MIYAFGRWEVTNSLEINGERTLIRNALCGIRTPIVFDVGANVGEWSRAVLAESEAATIYAFEPTPDARHELADLPVQIVPLAVSDEVGEAIFVVRGRAAGTNSLYCRGAEGDHIRVATTTITQFARERGIRHIDLLKIDVEGFDLSVLRGAEALLLTGAIAVAQFEYNARWIETRTFLKDVFEIAKGKPYAVGKVVENGVIIYPHWHYELDRYFEGNYVLVREDMLDKVSSKIATFDQTNTFDVIHDRIQSNRVSEQWRSR